MYSDGHKHVSDVQLELTVVFLNRTLLLWGQNINLKEEWMFIYWAIGVGDISRVSFWGQEEAFTTPPPWKLTAPPNNCTHYHVPIIDRKGCLNQMFCSFLTHKLLSALSSAQEGAHPPPLNFELFSQWICVYIHTMPCIHYLHVHTEG